MTVRAICRDRRMMLQLAEYVRNASPSSVSAQQCGLSGLQKFSSDSADSPSSKYNSATKRKILVNRLMYRSKQRGFLEMDLLLGQWAQDHVPDAEESLLAAFEGMLDVENPDLFKWLTGQEAPPPELESNMAFQEVRRHIGSQLNGVVESSARSKPGKEWLRGWDDWKKQRVEKIEIGSNQQ